MSERGIGDEDAAACRRKHVRDGDRGRANDAPELRAVEDNAAGIYDCDTVHAARRSEFVIRPDLRGGGEIAARVEDKGDSVGVNLSCVRSNFGREENEGYRGPVRRVALGVLKCAACNCFHIEFAS